MNDVGREFAGEQHGVVAGDAGFIDCQRDQPTGTADAARDGLECESLLHVNSYLPGCMPAQRCAQTLTHIGWWMSTLSARAS